jgi:hypothetical protein
VSFIAITTIGGVAGVATEAVVAVVVEAAGVVEADAFGAVVPPPSEVPPPHAATSTQSRSHFIVALP